MATTQDGARARTLSRGQMVVGAGVLLALGGGLVAAPDVTTTVLIWGGWALFMTFAAWRVVAILVSRPTDAAPAMTPPSRWPRYTVIAALRHEAGMIPQLVERLGRLDYPANRLEGFLALEADDEATIAAALACPRPDWLKLVIVPDGEPRTKPRALNFALARAKGEIVTVYDAEDEPDPGQLREAASRFAQASDTLACLQAPLRIRPHPASRSPLLDRQFSLEYAALFEVIAPALTRLGLPFPLGGTSNHFRASVLRQVGGWDAWNVTEDADLAFRLWRRGYRLGVLRRPTWETPPGDLDLWIPQRTRWLKGFMQTWGVHTREPSGLGWRGLLALCLTLGQTLISAPLHGLALSWTVVMVMGALVVGLPPGLPVFAWLVLAMGVAAALATTVAGARRAGVPWGVWDLICAPVYWTLLTLAFAHAAWRLVVEPYTWNKTPHSPEPVAAPVENSDAGSHRTGRQAA